MQIMLIEGHSSFLELFLLVCNTGADHMGNIIVCVSKNLSSNAYLCLVNSMCEWICQINKKCSIVSKVGKKEKMMA